MVTIDKKTRRTCPQTGEKTWIRDCLHDLRDFAQAKGLRVADEALRTAIIKVSIEADIATLLPIEELVKEDMTDHSIHPDSDS